MKNKLIYAAVNNFLLDIKVSDIKRFEKEFLEYMDTHHREIGKAILDKKVLDDELKSALESAIVEFKKIFLM